LRDKSKVFIPAYNKDKDKYEIPAYNKEKGEWTMIPAYQLIDGLKGQYYIPAYNSEGEYISILSGNLAGQKLEMVSDSNPTPPMKEI